MLQKLRDLLVAEPAVARAIGELIAWGVALGTGVLELGADELVGLLGLRGVVTWRQRAHVSPS